MHSEIADIMEANFEPEPAEPPETASRSENGAAASTITQAHLEAAIRLKGGRIPHLAKRLRTTEERIQELLDDPNCKVEVGQRGFIYEKAKSG